MNIILTGASGIGKTTLLHKIFGLDSLVTPKRCLKQQLHPRLGDWSYFGYCRLDRCIPEIYRLYPNANKIIADSSHAIAKTVNTLPGEWTVLVLDVPQEEHRKRFFSRRSSRSGLDKEKSFRIALKEQQSYLKKYSAITEYDLKELVS